MGARREERQEFRGERWEGGGRKNSRRVDKGRKDARRTNMMEKVGKKEGKAGGRS